MSENNGFPPPQQGPPSNRPGVYTGSPGGDPYGQGPQGQSWGGGPMQHQGHAGPPGPAGNLDNNDILAIILSLLLPGVGQILLGQKTKGIVILVASFVTCAGLGLLSVAACIDAYFVAMAKKRRPVGEWEFFPQ